MLRTDFEKDNAVFKEFSPSLMKILNVLFVISETFPCDIVITSVNDSKHMVGSQHYRNTAMDVRSHNMGSHKSEFEGRITRALGPNFTILLEGKGTPNEHWHIQLKKGTIP